MSDSRGKEALTEKDLVIEGIPVYRIQGFVEADGYVVKEQDVLKKKLKKLGLYGKQFGYSAFNPELLEMVIATGTFHRQDYPRANQIDCCLVDKNGEIRHEENKDIVSYMESSSVGKEGCFLVCRLDKLQGRIADEDLGIRWDETHYEFIDPDKKKEAVVAIIVIQDFR